MPVVIDGTNGITTPDVESTGPITGTTGAFSGNVTISGNAVVTGSVTANGVATELRPLVSGSSQNATSGTAIDFTGIPSWAKKITIMLSGVSTNASSSVIIQAGSTTFATSGYSGAYAVISTGTAATTSASGFMLWFNTSDAASAARSGIVTLTNIGGNTWVGSVIASIHSGGSITSGAGSVTLGGVLDRVRVTTNGSDTFDAGTINIIYE